MLLQKTQLTFWDYSKIFQYEKTYVHICMYIKQGCENKVLYLRHKLSPINCKWSTIFPNGVLFSKILLHTLYQLVYEI